jgi:hypothetical protein
MKTMTTTKKGKLNLNRESLVELDAKALAAANGGAASIRSVLPFSCVSQNGSCSYCPTR